MTVVLRHVPAITITEVPNSPDYEDWGLIPDQSACMACDSGVGVVLVGDYDNPAWRPAWEVIRTNFDELIGFLCEDCVFVADALAERADRPSPQQPSAPSPLPAVNVAVDGEYSAVASYWDPKKSDQPAIADDEYAYGEPEPDEAP